MALVEIDEAACKTLRLNRPAWNVIEGDVRAFHASRFRGVDLLAGGVPCPPFSVAGKQLGSLDDRDLFPEMLRLASECEPVAVMIENVRGLLDPKFESYRLEIRRSFEDMGYRGGWRLLNASDFGVSQSRSRAIFVALRRAIFPLFEWPSPSTTKPPSVGKVLFPEMSRLGWKLAGEWQKKANKIAPTLVGGSRKHGGPDLGPTRAREAWAQLGVDGLGLADKPPENGFVGMPRLTAKMTALLQGFPEDWVFVGLKTAAYRQIGNAFPPPVAEAVGRSIAKALEKRTEHGEKENRLQRHVALIPR